MEVRLYQVQPVGKDNPSKQVVLHRTERNGQTLLWNSRCDTDDNGFRTSLCLLGGAWFPYGFLWYLFHELVSQSREQHWRSWSEPRYTLDLCQQRLWLHLLQHFWGQWEHIHRQPNGWALLGEWNWVYNGQ